MGVEVGKGKACHECFMGRGNLGSELLKAKDLGGGGGKHHEVRGRAPCSLGSGGRGHVGGGGWRAGVEPPRLC